VTFTPVGVNVAFSRRRRRLATVPNPLEKYREIGASWARLRGRPLHLDAVVSRLAGELELRAMLLQSMAEGWDDTRWELVIRALLSAAAVLRNPVRLPEAIARRLDDDDPGPALRAASGVAPALARELDALEVRGETGRAAPPRRQEPASRTSRRR